MGNLLTPHEKLFEMMMTKGFPKYYNNYTISYDFENYDADIVCNCDLIEKIEILKRLIDD